MTGRQRKGAWSTRRRNAEQDIYKRRKHNEKSQVTRSHINTNNKRTTNTGNLEMRKQTQTNRQGGTSWHARLKKNTGEGMQTKKHTNRTFSIQLAHENK